MKKRRVSIKSYFCNTDVVTLLVEWLAPIHVLSLVRAIPDVRKALMTRNRTVYEVCVSKIQTYTKWSNFTITDHQLNLLLSPVIGKEYVLLGECLKRALTWKPMVLCCPTTIFMGRNSYGEANRDLGLIVNEIYSRNLILTKDTILDKLPVMGVYKAASNIFRYKSLTIAYPWALLRNESTLHYDELFDHIHDVVSANYVTVLVKLHVDTMHLYLISTPDHRLNVNMRSTDNPKSLFDGNQNAPQCLTVWRSTWHTELEKLSAMHKNLTLIY